MPVFTLKYRKLKILAFIIILTIAGLVSIEWIGKLVYPINYKEYISEYSQRYDIDPRLVASIIRVESKYFEDAESHKGARGLMQVTPSTGRWVAEKIGITNYHDDLLYDPETNIMIGCWYINNLNYQFNNNLQLVIAAYNGGSGNVSKWLSDERYSYDGLNLHNIPFKETEQYVQKVLRSYEMYKKLYDYEYFYE